MELNFIIAGSIDKDSMTFLIVIVVVLLLIKIVINTSKKGK